MFSKHTYSSKVHVVSCINTQGLHSQANLSSGPPTECNNILTASAFNASSSSSGTGGSSLDAQSRPQGCSGQGPWLYLELSDRSTITGRRFELKSCWFSPYFVLLTGKIPLFPGVITTGSAQHYIESFLVYSSKDRKNWKLHRDVLSKERKVRTPPTILAMRFFLW